MSPVINNPVKKEEHSTNPTLASFTGTLPQVVMLLIVNCIVIVFMAFLAVRLPSKANEVKQVRNVSLQSRSGGDLASVNRVLASATDKIALMNQYIPDENGIVTFVQKLSDLKKEGVISTFTFASEEPVKDRLGFIGLPILVEIQGDQSVQTASLQKIMALPYFIRLITVEYRSLGEEESPILRLGGVLYVNQTFTNR